MKTMTLFATMLFATIPAKAADCSVFFADLMNHRGGIDLTMTNMNLNGTASYGRFAQLVPSPSRLFGAGKTRLLGQGKQLFNDRPAYGPQPFDVSRADDMRVEIETRSGAITFTSITWNAKFAFHAKSCGAGLAHGGPEGGASYYILHFEKTPPIP